MEYGTRSQSVEEPPFDSVLSLLADRRRRYVVAHLSDRDAAVPLDDLAGAVATWETDGEADDDTTDDVAIALHHVHLPKLDRAGVVEYDGETKTITPAQAEAVAQYVDDVEQAD